MATSPQSTSERKTPRHVAVVPHTHWDREWYEPFQTLPAPPGASCSTSSSRLLERDPSYARFLLDGQMAVVDDYLEVRPENEDRIRALAAAGRLSMGPWYILMDEFLVSGETIVRDLQLGLARGAGLRRGHGGRLPARHVRPHRPDAPDPPPGRLRARRGVAGRARRSIDRTAFWWEAPDGSTVRAEYLPDRVRQRGRPSPTTPRRSCGGSPTTRRRSASFLLDGHAVHERHRPPGAPALARPGRGRGQRPPGRLRARGHLPRRLPGRRPHRRASATWKGELRSGARANVLMGVASNRVDVKRGGGARRAGPRAPGRAAVRPVPRRPSSWPEPPARPGLARDGPQRRPRLDLRLLGRRGGRRRARPLRRGPPDRRRARPTRRSRRSRARWPSRARRW